MSKSAQARGALRECLGGEDKDDTDLMAMAATTIVWQHEEIERLRKEVVRLDKLSDDLHASKAVAIVEQTKSRDRALVAERKVKALRTALLVLTDPEQV